MARCKCQICKAELDSKTAFKVTDKNGKNKYYCSEIEYDAEEQRKKKVAEDKEKVYRLICDILDEEEILNTALWKEKAIWNKAFSDEIIAKYLAENKDYLTSAVSQLSGTEYGKIRYVSAVLKNSLRDFKPKMEEQPKPKVTIDETIYDVPTHSLNRRRSLADLEDDI
jgi:hypothetical protein